MKKLFSLLVLLIISSNAIFSQNKQVECVSISNEGSIILKIWSAKKGKKYKQVEAFKDALEIYLINGLNSESCGNVSPLLKTESEKTAFIKIKSEFFTKKGDWNRFVTNSTTVSTTSKLIDQTDWKTYQVSISKNELRKYLENKSILQPLNTGF